MNPYYAIGYWLCTLVAKLGFRHKVYGRENLIEDGPAILASNHQSYLDPPMVGICCRKAIYFLARDTLFKIKVAGWIIAKLNTVPVDRMRGDISAIKTIIRFLQEGKRVIIFPEGTRSLDGRLQPARAGLGMVIGKTLAPVVPVRIFGSYEALPKTGRLKLFQPITVVIGKPIRFTKADLEGGGREIYQQLSERVMAEIAKLELPAERRPQQV
ncbi:MAG: 1-acyl-sn-glycerol-3-phosphate acyltransferase [Verrucomicrobia bacterium]|nr:1-acyl-sn-glycerol-3-phosphate acyltransferase [Verrucomicrobiota bacterium]